MKSHRVQKWHRQEGDAEKKATWKSQGEGVYKSDKQLAAEAKAKGSNESEVTKSNESSEMATASKSSGNSEDELSVKAQARLKKTGNREKLLAGSTKDLNSKIEDEKELANAPEGSKAKAILPEGNDGKEEIPGKANLVEKEKKGGENAPGGPQHVIVHKIEIKMHSENIQMPTNTNGGEEKAIDNSAAGGPAKATNKAGGKFDPQELKARRDGLRKVTAPTRPALSKNPDDYQVLFKNKSKAAVADESEDARPSVGTDSVPVAPPLIPASAKSNQSSAAKKRRNNNATGISAYEQNFVARDHAQEEASERATDRAAADSNSD